MPHAMMLFVLGLLPGTAESLSFAAAAWAPPRRAEALVAHRPLGEFVRTLDRRDAGVLRIRHAGGEPDSRFAEQLRDALVALGVPAARIRLVPAAADADRLILEFSANGETGP
jgi:hypothetical protein